MVLLATIHNTGVGAGNCVGVRSIHARITPNLPEKLLSKHEGLFLEVSKSNSQFILLEYV